MNSRVVVLLLLSFLVFLLAGCARSLSPDPHRAAAASPASIHALSRGTATGIVLRIEGATVTLGGDFQPHVDLHTRFEIPIVVLDPLTGLYGSADTIPALSVFKGLKVENGAAIDPIEGGGVPGAAIRTGIAVGDSIHGAFQLQLPHRLGGALITVRLFQNFAPDGWWAGPAPELWPASSDGDGRAVEVLDWPTFSTSPAWPPDGRAYFGPDSFRWIPSTRRPPGNDFQRRTFYEFYGNRIYARSEGDTVHLNSIVVFCNGAYDKDSKYLPKIDFTDPGLPAGFQSNPDAFRVLFPLGLVGSPIGFRTQVVVRREDGTRVPFVQSGLYPDFEPASVFRYPAMFGYWQVMLAGKWAVVSRAQDGDGLVDQRVSEPLEVAEHVDSGAGTPEERAARHEVLVFYAADRTSAASRAAALSPPGYSGSAPRRGR